MQVYCYPRRRKEVNKTEYYEKCLFQSNTKVIHKGSKASESYLPHSKERQPAPNMNKSLEELLQTFSLKPKRLELGARIIKDRYKTETSDSLIQVTKMQALIEKNNQRLKNARLLMLDGELEVIEYHSLKQSIEEEITKAQQELTRLATPDTNFNKRIDSCIDLLKNLAEYYKRANTQLKQRIIGSIFPGN